MGEFRTPTPTEAPRVNFARGLRQVDLGSEFGTVKRGKVRDKWEFQKDGEELLALITTDRASAFDHVICTVPGKGQVLNLTSAYWFELTKDIIPNHVVSVPHPNVLIAKKQLRLCRLKLF